MTTTKWYQSKCYLFFQLQGDGQVNRRMDQAGRLKPSQSTWRRIAFRHFWNSEGEEWGRVHRLCRESVPVLSYSTENFFLKCFFMVELPLHQILPVPSCLNVWHQQKGALPWVESTDTRGQVSILYKILPYCEEWAGTALEPFTSTCTLITSLHWTSLELVTSQKSNWNVLKGY